jgi:hypothetical protein
MAASTDIWHESFPYGRSAVAVTRLPSEWQISLGGRVVTSRSLVDAFESLLGRSAAQDELRVVLAALARDRDGRSGLA